MQRIYLVVALLFVLSPSAFGQTNSFLPCNISDRTIQYFTGIPCGTGTGVDIYMSQIGVVYSLRNNIGNAVVDGPIDGTGGWITLQTGPLTQGAVFNIYAEQRTEAVEFDGVDDYINVSSLTNLSGNAITIEYWFKGSDIQSAVRYQQSGTSFVVSGWNELHIMSNDGGVLDGLPIGAGVTDGNWHHVAMTWEINTVNGFKSYLDGVLVAQRNSSNTPITNEFYSLLLGAYAGATEFMTGSLDQVRVWTVARSESEIQAGMNQCDMTGQPGLELYYQFEDGSGSNTVTDLSGNGHTGILSNMNATSSWVHGTTVCSTCNFQFSTEPDVYLIPVDEYAISTVSYSSICSSDTVVNLENSQTDIDYYLRNDANNAVIDGPIAGTGGPISFNTGVINSTTTYHVFGTNTAGCTMQSPNTVTVSIVPISDQPFVTNDINAVCEIDTTIEIANSEVGVSYYLRDANNAILDGPVAGTGGAIQFNTGLLSASTVLFVDAQVGTPAVGIQLDGVDDFLADSSSFSNGYAGTYEAWVKFNSFAGNGTIVQVGSQNKWWVDSLGRQHVAASMGGGLGDLVDLSGVQIPLGEWVHLAVYDYAYTFSADFYINGVKTYSTSAFTYTPDPQPQAIISFGGNSYPSSLGGFLDGSIDEILLWSSLSPPTDSLIQSHMYGCVDTALVDLYEYYPMNEGAGLSTQDITANPQTITMINGSAATMWTTGAEVCGVHSCSLQLSDTVVVSILPISDEGVVVSDMELCALNSGTTVTISNSQAGVDYFLRDDATNAIVEGPVQGTGAALVFNTGAISSSTTYNVYATAASCSLEFVATAVVTVYAPINENVNQTICFNDSVVVNGTAYNAAMPSGMEIIQVPRGSIMCDSVIGINLNVLPEINSSVLTTICSNESVVVNGTTYDALNPTGTEVFTAANGCDSTVTINLNVIPAMDVTTSVSGVTITANETNATYQWLDCGNGNTVISGATNQSYTASANGDYAVILTANNCADTSACVVIDNVAIEEQAFNTLRIYPNPTRDLVVIELSDAHAATGIELRDVRGRLLDQVLITQEVITLNLSAYEVGVYFVVVSFSNGEQVQRIVKQ